MRLLNPSPSRAKFERVRVVSVIASSIRKGNVVERDGKLYVVLRAENVHPGKGTPVTHLEMRRISDGVKVNDRFKTTASVEKAFIDSGSYNYLYQDGDSYVFMEPRTFEQLYVPAEIIGDAAVYLQENMEVSISQHNGIPISIELPARVVLEVVETEPVVKGQTASSSFKPAVLSNGVRTGVPPHISTGTRICGSDRRRRLSGARERLRFLEKCHPGSPRGCPGPTLWKSAGAACKALKLIPNFIYRGCVSVGPGSAAHRWRGALRPG